MAKQSETKQTKGQVEQILAELGKRIDVLIKETKGAKDEVRDEVEKKVMELRKKKDKLEAELRSYRDKNGDKWEDVRSHLLNAGQELRKAVESVFKDKNDKTT